MSEHPDLFDAFTVRFVEAGEASGTLPHVLNELARMARLRKEILVRTRFVVAYPLCVMLFSMMILLLILRFVIPNFDTVFADMLGNEPLPGLTQLVLTCSRLVQTIWMACVIGYVLVVVALVWLLSGGKTADRFLAGVVGWLPGVAVLYMLYDYACACSLWDVYVRNNIPMHDALEMVAEGVKSRGLKEDFQEIAAEQRDGIDLGVALAGRSRLDSLLLLTVLHTPDAELAEALTGLGTLYSERAANVREALVGIWEIALLAVVSVVVGFMILGMFMPLIKLIEKL